MKFTINIECTPDEARDFMGLPDPKVIQEKMFSAMQGKMTDLPAGWDAWQDMQKMMWEQMSSAMNTPTTDPKSKK
jgi:hypothetical protein